MDQAALDKLEAIEKNAQNLQNLLTQAVQAMQECKVIMDDVNANHHPTPKLDEAIRDVQDNLNQVTNAHNSVVAELKAAKDEVIAKPDPEPSE